MPRLLDTLGIIPVSVAAMETRRYSRVVASNLLSSGFWRKDTKISLCLSQPGERSSQGLMPSSQVGRLPFLCLMYNEQSNNKSSEIDMKLLVRQHYDELLLDSFVVTITSLF